MLVGRAGAGWEDGVMRNLVAETGARSHAGYALLTNTPVVVTDFAAERRFSTSIAERLAVRSGANTLVRGREHPFGVLAIHDIQPRQFSHDEVNFLQSVANILGLAIGQHQTEQRGARQRALLPLAHRGHQRSHQRSSTWSTGTSSSALRWKGFSATGSKSWSAGALSICAILTSVKRLPRTCGASPNRARRNGSLRARLRHKDGSWRVLEWNGRSALDIKGASCLVANGRDVTARERMLNELRDSERRFHGIFDSSHDAIVIATPDDGRIVDVNSAFSRIYGHSHEQALGKDPQGLALFANPEDYCRFAREVLERGALSNFETDLRTADGKTVPTLLSAVMVDLGVGVRVVSILRDISERRAADLELARARDAALESTRLKSAFLANTSHEIRTPLNVILGYTDLVGEHLADIGDHTQDAYLEALGRAGRRLLKTIQQILDYSRMEARALTLNPSAIALAPFIEDQAHDFNVLAAEKGLKLRLEIAESDATVRFDEYCLQSALSNLLQNAIKFTDRGEIVLGPRSRQHRHAETRSPRHRHRHRQRLPAAAVRALLAGADRPSPALRRRGTGPGLRAQVRRARRRADFRRQPQGRGLDLHDRVPARVRNPPPPRLALARRISRRSWGKN